MTKKDFVAIAGAIKDAREALRWSEDDADAKVTNAQERAFDSMARSIAKVCAGQNPKFQRERFLAQCGVK